MEYSIRVQLALWSNARGNNLGLRECNDNQEAVAADTNSGHQ